MIRLVKIFLLIAATFVTGCSSYESFSAQKASDPIDRGKALEIGMQNAVKKAYQMTDLTFTPLAEIAYLSGKFKAGKTYTGVIYSSAKELECFVGNDVSIHTYMTAIHNPRSVIYTEDISAPPYHGLNCKTYYGTVCSSFVSYALGIVPRYWANDFPLSDVMREVDYTNPDSLCVADVLWRKGHVAMITDIEKNKDNRVLNVEISENAGSTCKRYYKSWNEFCGLMTSSFEKVFRYTELYKNLDYISYPEFVAVKGETPLNFVYNNDLCTSKGDKACYIENEDVVVNVLREYDLLEVYKDEKLVYEIEANGNQDVTLSGLEYGDYKARVVYTVSDTTGAGSHMSKKTCSDFTNWIVVDVNVVADRSQNRIYFSSANATPQCVRYCDIHGNGGSLTTSNRHVLSQEEKQQGYIDVLPDEIRRDFPYVRVNFATDYGRVINIPINWFE